MLKFRHRAVVAALAFVCVLTACDDSPPAPQERAPVANQNTPASKPATVPKDMVAAVSAGKASDLISLHFSLGAPPTVNVPLPVNVAIVPHLKFSSIRVHFESQDGLAAAAGENFGPVTDAKAETALSHQLVLLPTREGMFVVTSSVETESEDSNITRIFSIPVIVTATPEPAPTEKPGVAPAPPPASK
jgi:hypothetical protein